MRYNLGRLRRYPLALGKDFRLPLDARPLRYAAHLAPDLEAGTFEGRVELEVRLDKPRRELILHALELSVDPARLRAGGRAIPGGRIEPHAGNGNGTPSLAPEGPA